MNNWNYPASLALALKHMDRTRQARGKWLDSAGFGPKETPSAILHSEPGLNVRKYGQDDAGGPAFLIVPAPIKKSYIWDLAPEVSVVRRCLEHGYQVYMAEWTPAPDIGDDFGLDDYSDRLLGVCQQVIKSDSASPEIVIAGHSLGGILTAIFSGLHPELVRATILLEAPLHFAQDHGCFAPLVRATPDARPIAAACRQVPGTFLNMVSAAASPQAFQWERFVDRCLSMMDQKALTTHMQVERWTHDEFPLPGRLFTDIVESLFRNDELMRGTLAIGDRRVGPADLRAPLLSVFDPRSTVIPPQSVLPFHEGAASEMKQVMRYEGDIGVNLQHVGVLVGASAHNIIWPAIFDWLERVSCAEDQVA